MTDRNWNWRVEFPDYPKDAMPVIGAEWEDCSWSNDSCPSFRATLDDGLHVAELWVDYPDPAMRSSEEAKRFTVMTRDKDDNTLEIFESDDLAEALAFVARVNGQE